MLKPRRACLEPGCPNLTYESRCEFHARQHERARRARDDVTGRRDPTPQWRKARRQALVRDRHKCQLCGRSQRKDSPLEVHHINGTRGDDRVENLVTLCATCHRAADRALGKVR